MAVRKKIVFAFSFLNRISQKNDELDSVSYAF